jgi:DNA-binding GntR family transcriptional regulator
MMRQEAAARIDDYASFFDADEDFHALLAQMAAVPSAWHLVQSVKTHVDRERFILMSSIRGRSERAYGDHLRILAAIRAGDGERAAAEMAAHVESVLRSRDPATEDAEAV